MTSEQNAHPADARPRTLAEKVWDAHVVVPGENGKPDLLYIDLQLLHEVTSPQAFEGLRKPQYLWYNFGHTNRKDCERYACRYTVRSGSAGSGPLAAVPAAPFF